MKSDEIQERAAARTEELPGAELTYPFGAEWEVFKVRGKVFMLLTELHGEPLVILKAHPADALRYQQAFPGITPGYHMNKKHWITLRAAQELEASFIDELVTDSYLLVVEKLPKRDQPVDPARFGRPA